jgi:hypothetical protein
MPGRNTAEVILQDQGMKIEQVAARRTSNRPHKPQLI